MASSVAAPHLEVGLSMQTAPQTPSVSVDSGLTCSHTLVSCSSTRVLHCSLAVGQARLLHVET